MKSFIAHASSGSQVGCSLSIRAACRQEAAGSPLASLHLVGSDSWSCCLARFGF